MISVKEAKEIIQKKVPVATPVRSHISMAAGLVVAEDLFAKYDIPAFEQSSMDGYAIMFKDRDNPLIITGEMAAGANILHEINTGQCARIFTGAPIPLHADTVVMQEKVLVENGKILIKNDALKQGDFVRARGAEIKKNALALNNNSLLTPAALGFLAGIGIEHLLAFPPPKVSIIITGNELQKPGNELQFGQVYESNSFMLTAALKQAGVVDITVFEAKDEKDILITVLKKSLLQSDFILLTGGVSVGDYDFVVEATKACGIIQHFHKIKQKPGKPLYFGTKENKVVFGLPGNPASVLTCFYEYVLEALEKWMQKNNSVKKIKAILQNDLTKPAGLTQFIKAHFEDGKVNILSAQASFQLNSFAIANCFIVVDENVAELKKGDEVTLHLFP